MTEHESNLHDLYVGLAMMALLGKAPKAAKLDEIAYHAHDQADALLEERSNRTQKNEGGIADILNKWGDKS